MTDPAHHHPLRLDGTHLDIASVQAYCAAWHGTAPQRVELTPTAWDQVAAAAAHVQQLVASGEPVYGVTTGVGDLARERIAPEQSSAMQHNILRSHAAAWGEPFSADIVRAAMLVRLNTWALGRSGLRRQTVQLYLDLLNRGIVPVVYEKGSLGASGDLAPLAMLSLPLIGEGEVWWEGGRQPAAEALPKAGLEPLTLTYKEALALINGTTLMAGEGALLLLATRRLYSQALAAYALCVEALCGKTEAFHFLVQQVRRHPGQVQVAGELRRLLRGSTFVDRSDGKVQDGYSLRCIPQIAVPSFEALANAERTLEIELNSASDNPLLFHELELGDSCIGAGNFHGQSLAMAFDFLAIATAEIASLAERQTNRLMNAHLSGLEPFLALPAGLNSGLMVAHYAQAALVSECRTLCHPAVVDNIPTSADQEDHVNMGPVALRKYRTILANAQGVVAILLLCAAQAVDLRRRSAGLQPASQEPLTERRSGELQLGAGTQAAYDRIREHVPFMDGDRVLYPEIARLTELVMDGAFCGQER
jgi:histidine ammonia-lyase